MSTGPRPQAAFIQVNQNAAEQDASHSALFYLFQEVSKLASPTHSSFLDTNSPSRWLNETSRQGNFFVKKEEDESHSFQPCQHSLSRVSAYSHVNSVKEESHSNKFTTSVEPRHECSSPWKVLSLINLQCERLMHRRHVEDSDQSSVSSTTSLPKEHPTAKSLTAAADLAEQGCVRPVEDVRGDCTRGVNKYQPQSCAKVSKKDCRVQPQTAEKTEAVMPELVEENAAASSQDQHRDKREVKFSVNRRLVWNQECKTDSFSTEQDILNVPPLENALSQTHIPNASQNTKLTFNSNEDDSVAVLKQPLTLDCNANIVLTTEPPCDTQVPPPSSILPSSLFFNTSECHSLPEQDNKITEPKPECTHTPTEKESPPVSVQLKSYNVSSATSKQDPREAQKVETSPKLTQQWRTRTPRKQPHPSRSVDIQDPDLQGVTFRMDTEVDDSREQCRLLITSKYRY